MVGMDASETPSKSSAITKRKVHCCKDFSSKDKKLHNSVTKLLNSSINKNKSSFFILEFLTSLT